MFCQEEHDGGYVFYNCVVRLGYVQLTGDDHDLAGEAREISFLDGEACHCEYPIFGEACCVRPGCASDCFGCRDWYMRAGGGKHSCRRQWLVRSRT